MADEPTILMPYFVVEQPSEGGPGVFTNNKLRREPVRGMFAAVELDDAEKSTLWRSLGSQGLVVQTLAVAFVNNPGLYEAVGAMMQLLINVAERSKR